MKVRGDLDVRGTILQNGAPVGGTTLTVSHSDGSQTFTDIAEIKVNVDGFYLTQNAGSPDEVILNLRGTKGAVTTNFTSTVEVELAHNLNSKPLLWATFNDADEAFVPNRVDVSDPNIAFFYFDSVISGSLIVSLGGAGATGADGADGAAGATGPAGAAGKEFYLTLAHSDDSAVFRDISVIKVEVASFYLTQNFPNTDEVLLSFRGSAAGGGTDTTFKETEAGGFSVAAAILSFHEAFYLSSGGAGNPVIVALKDSPTGLVETQTVQIEVASIKTYVLDLFADYAYSINRFVGQTASGGAIGGFYINDISVTGLDPVTFYPQLNTVIPTGALSLLPGDKLTLSIFDNERALDVAFNLKTQRD